MWMCEVYHLELVSRDAKEHCFLQHHWLTFCIFEVREEAYIALPRDSLITWWQPRHRRDWPRCRRSPRWPWFALVPRKFWHLPCDLTTIALVGPWVFWCQLKMTSCFWLLSCRPVLLRISQLIQPDKPLETPGLSAGATPLVRAHHCKGKRGYWPNAEHWFLNHWMILIEWFLWACAYQFKLATLVNEQAWFVFFVFHFCSWLSRAKWELIYGDQVGRLQTDL